MNRKSLILLSGGIDSTTLLYRIPNNPLIEIGECTALIFDYGQTLDKEVDIAVDNAQALGAAPKVVRLDLGWLDENCALLKGNPVPVPTGRGLAEIRGRGTPPTWVPFRNGIFLAYAVGYCEARDIPTIFIGANGLESGNYWDDRQEFIDTFNTAAGEGTKPEYTPQIIAPFSMVPKWRIVEMGRIMGVDYDRTWSCYLNGEKHCGECDSCVQREEALDRGGWYKQVAAQ